MSVQNSVFISYRRSNIYIARAVYQELKNRNFDVFLDYNSIDNGSFERIILSQIRARQHFLLILTPDTLERCVSPDDWVRREIECALANKRNIVPIMFDKFDFEQHGNLYLTGTLGQLPRYNALQIHADYFDEGIQRLINRFLNNPLDTILHPIPESEIAENADYLSLEKLREAEEWLSRAKQLVKAEQWKQAWAAFSHVLELNPESVEAHYERALIAKQHGRIELAIQEMSYALDYDPRNFHIFCKRADCYFELGNHIKAIADYTAALALNPPYISAYLGRGKARAKRGDYSRALNDFEAILKIAPQHDVATKEIQKVRKLRSESSNAIAKIGNMFGISQTDFEPETAMEYYNRAMSLSEDDFDARLADLTRALAVDPNLKQALLARASIYYHNDQFEQALQDNTHVIELTPENYLAYANRSEIYLAIQEFQSAQHDAEKSLSIQADNIFAQSILAIALYHLGEKDAALEHWHSLMQKDEFQRNIKRLAKKLNWHDNIVALAMPLIDTLD